LNQPIRAAADASSALYVVNQGNQSISVYSPITTAIAMVAPGASIDLAAVSRIQPGPAFRLVDPDSIAATPAGRLFVTDGNRVLVINRDSSGIFTQGQVLTSQPLPGFGPVVLESLMAPAELAIRCAGGSCPIPSP
jgi:DNA-binding beta-propeller fold protein YncE